MCVKYYTDDNGNTKSNFPYVRNLHHHKHSYIVLRQSVGVSLGARGWKEMDARATDNILGQVVVADSTPLHELLETGFYSDVSMLSSDIPGLVV